MSQSNIIAVLPGDGVGEEVMAEALRVLDVVLTKSNITFAFEMGLIGGAAYDKYGEHFPSVTKELCEKSTAILFGSVGGPVSKQHEPKWTNCEANTILALRKTFGFNANFRPINIFPELKELCPLKPELVEKGIDILFIRELVGDIYFGEHKTTGNKGNRLATDVAQYTEEQISNVAHTAFQAAIKRNKKLTSVDKANVLDTSKLWRTVVEEIKEDYPEVELEHMLVDNCAMQIIKNPAQFDVVLTSNMFGDILSDAAAVLPGSLGLLASASINADGFGLYEPPGGSAQDIAGLGVANPIGQILSSALMLRFSFGLEAEASAIEQAVSKALAKGFRTKDIHTPGTTLVSTSEMADAVISNI